MKRIAFLGRGVHTIPSYRALLNLLAADYKIIVYSEVALDPTWLQLKHKYAFRYSKAMALPRRVREFFFLIWLIKEHIRMPFDLVHAHSTFPTGFTAVILQKLFGIPAVVSLDGGEGISFPDINFGDAHHINRTAINKWVITRAKIVTTLTYFHRDLIYKNLSICRPIEILLRGVDNKKFLFAINKQIVSPVKFLSVGYLSPIKDPEMLLTTFSIIQQQVNSRLIHIGEDYMNGAIHQMAKDMGISDKVSFINYVDYDMLADYYKSADILLHTARFESQGMVIGEAMASGVLVCGTHVGLLADLSGQCCLTVPPMQAEALATAVLDLLQRNEKMNRLRTNAYYWSEANNLESSVANFRNVYAQLLNS